MSTANFMKAKAQRRMYHHGDLRNALIREGRLLLEEVGPGTFSLREVARRIGVTIAAPARHFASREALLAAIAASGFDELAEERSRLLDACHQDPLELTRRMMRTYIAFAQRHKGLFYLMVGPTLITRASYPDLADSSRRSFDLFARAVTAYAKLQHWPNEALDPLVYAAWAAEHGTAMLILGDRVPRPQFPIEIGTMVEFSITCFLAAVVGGPANFRIVDPFVTAGV